MKNLWAKYGNDIKLFALILAALIIIVYGCLQLVVRASKNKVANMEKQLLIEQGRYGILTDAYALKMKEAAVLRTEIGKRDTLIAIIEQQTKIEHEQVIQKYNQIPDSVAIRIFEQRYGGTIWRR